MKAPGELEVNNFKSYILEHYGLEIQYHQHDKLVKYMQDTCEQLKIANYDTLLLNLCHGDSALNTRMIQQLCKCITVDESYFFRDQKQMEYLGGVFLPKLLKERIESGSRKIRILSAGCSSGQELYTTLIWLDKILGDLSGWSITAIGIDINEHVLEQARLGIYRSFSFRTMADSDHSKYFTPVDAQHHQIRKNYLQYARFHNINLAEIDKGSDVLESCGGFDLIFCRNVFIYMNQPTIKHILKYLSKILSDDGILLLGPADMLERKIESLKLNYNDDVVTYSKNILAKEDSVDMCPIINKKVVANAPDLPQRQQEPTEEAEPQADAADDVDSLQQQALMHANLGDYEKGLKVIERCLTENEYDAGSYYIKGLISMGLKQYADAEAQFKSAMFLDNRLPEAAYRLGICMQLNGEIKNGKKMLNTALKIAKSCNPDQVLIDMPEMTARSFCDVLEAELSE